MIDIHSHIIFGVDDGAKTKEESGVMLRAAKNTGISTIIVTPHFNERYSEKDAVFSRYLELVKEAEKNGIALLYGREVKINQNLPDLLDQRDDLLLNKTNFILIETPFNYIPWYTYDTIYRLQLRGLNVIIAHPERNIKIVNDFDELEKFILSGCLIQVDAASITGLYGWRVKNFAKSIIRRELVHFVSSDAHNPDGYLKWYPNAYRIVKGWVGEEGADAMFDLNVRALL